VIGTATEIAAGSISLSNIKHRKTIEKFNEPSGSAGQQEFKPRKGMRVQESELE